ncbi:MAG TPA: hydratase [Candidatus Gemmiger stercorigallinarum]|nr:hydratase [Candidatus Gemmiger stercorigallinarum]
MKLHDKGVYLVNGQLCDTAPVPPAEARKGTIAYGILQAHNTVPDMDDLRLKFDSMTSHDITYVGIIQTARASGMDKFPMPYVLTNCHNTLCAVGGTINEDDHQFALSAAHKYGGIYVPPNMAVIHSYNREMMSGCGRMILGSDSHTRYGALGTMAVGEGGGELAKQLVGRTYDMAYPGVVAIYLTGKPNPGVGPQDVALALVGATYANGYVKNKVMEFVGPGVAGLSADFRNGIDVMTTETTCWSSIWQTDEVTKEYFEIHGRPEAYKPLAPADVAYYDGCIELDLSTVECMIALPMHPSYAYPIRELKANAKDILHEIETRANQQLNGKVRMDLVGKVAADGSIRVDQGIVAGCSGGTFENVCAVAQILKGKNCGAGTFRISVYPDSMPTYLELVKNGAVADIVSAGGIFRECFCGPCFGAGDTPANGEFSIRHTTRNFPNREGSKPGEGQISAVALMDARSIAATAANGGVLTAASEVLDRPLETPPCRFDAGIYEKRVYNGWGKAEPDYALKFGPNIKDWPEQPALTDDLLLKIASYITDPVTTTDELIPSGETSSYRSNPLRLAEFTLSRKDPAYVGRAKAVKAMDEARKAGSLPAEVQAVYDALAKAGVQADGAAANIGSAVFAVKPGDGSAREQAASCQRVLGGAANFACEYATKRYRSNCINWGMLPFLVEDPDALAQDSYVFVPGVRRALLEAADAMTGYVVGADGSVTPVTLRLGALTDDERQILADGCLINYYKNH